MNAKTVIISATWNASGYWTSKPHHFDFRPILPVSSRSIGSSWTPFTSRRDSLGLFVQTNSISDVGLRCVSVAQRRRGGGRRQSDAACCRASSGPANWHLFLLDRCLCKSTPFPSKCRQTPASLFSAEMAAAHDGGVILSA